MKTTPYFEEQVLQKRSYLKREWCELALKIQSAAKSNPMVACATGFSSKRSENTCVVTLDDGETLLNAFPDRNFKERSE